MIENWTKKQRKSHPNYSEIKQNPHFNLKHNYIHTILGSMFIVFFSEYIA